MTAAELNERLIVAEDALAELSKDDLVSLLCEIGYSPAAIDLSLIHISEPTRH